MDKPEAKDEVVKNVLDYTKAAWYIDTVLGYKQRDAAGKYDYLKTGGDRPDKPYLDYWHYFMEVVEIEGNDTYCRGMHSFKDIHSDTETQFGSDDWRTKIAAVWASEYPDRYTLWMSW